MAVDPNDFLFNSDYQMDKIVYYYNGAVTPNAYGAASFPHGLGFVPLLFGFWSDDLNFGTAHSLTSATFTNPADFSVIYDSMRVYSDEQDVHFLQSFGSFRTVYVRLYGVMPSNVDKKAGPTSDEASTFVFNTDYNYRKLFQEGVSPITLTSSGFFNPVSVSHGLGYKPQVMAWLEMDVDGALSELSEIDFAELANNGKPTGGVSVFDDRVEFRPPAPQYGDSFKVHYRIYYDEQA